MGLLKLQHIVHHNAALVLSAMWSRGAGRARHVIYKLQGIIEHDILSGEFQQHGIIEELVYVNVLTQA